MAKKQKRNSAGTQESGKHLGQRSVKHVSDLRVLRSTLALRFRDLQQQTTRVLFTSQKLEPPLTSA